MYYTGIDPRTMQSIYVARTPEEKRQQRALLQWRRPEVRRDVIAALKKAGREDLIGFGPDCLVRPDYSPKKKAPAKSGEKPTAKAAAKAAPAAAEKPAKPVRKAGWAKAKPKKNARPVKKTGKK